MASRRTGIEPIDTAIITNGDGGSSIITKYIPTVVDGGSAHIDNQQRS